MDTQSLEFRYQCNFVDKFSKFLSNLIDDQYLKKWRHFIHTIHDLINLRYITDLNIIAETKIKILEKT